MNAIAPAICLWHFSANVPGEDSPGHFAPLQGWRHVLDNLNIHTPASLYQTFEGQEARRILEKLEFHYTPKHGSCLNRVEIQLSILVRQCLKRRIPDLETLRQEVSAWQQQRNAPRATVDWQFTSTDARAKLKRLYPAIHSS